MFLPAVLLVVASACGSSLPSGQDERVDTDAGTSIPSSSIPSPEFEDDDRYVFDCYLSTIMLSDTGTTGAVVATVNGVEPMARSDFPWDVDYERPYLDVSATVDEVAQGTPTFSPAVGAPMPDLAVGGEIRLVVYHDTSEGMVEQVLRLGSNGGQAVFLLIALADFDNPDAEGVWGVRRVATVIDEALRFEGTCGEDVTATFAAAADQLGRPPDTSFLLDYATEEAARYDTGDGPGPIGQVVYDIEVAELPGSTDTAA